MTEQVTSASALVQELTTRLQEPEWMQQIREKAWKAYQELPLPWVEKTDLKKRGWDFGPFPTEQPAVVEGAQEFVDACELPVVFVVDGIVAQIRVPDELKIKGVIFTDIHTAVREHEALVKKHYGTVVKTDENKWTALNAALFNGGVFLYVPRDVQIETPFQVVYSESDAGKGAFPRSLVIGEALSSFAVTEVHFTASERTSGLVHSTVLEVVAEADSKITVAAIDQFHKGPTNYVTRRATVGKDADVEWIAGDVSDGFTVALIESVLEGSGSRSNARVLGLGYGRQHSELTMNMKHIGRNSESDIVMHGVLRDKANMIFRSSTHIVRGAIRAGSEQSDRMIMVDGTARADAIPMLLIDENDVQRCGHAASVGKIDVNQIYYLMSRGIPKMTATQMIIWGYLNETVQAIPGEKTHELIVSRIAKELSR